jgi:FkbH-like protein
MIRPSEAEQLVELLRARSAAHPGRPALTFLAQGEIEAGVLSFGELDRRARAVARGLQERGVAAGDRVLLCGAEPRDYVLGFLGCLYAGGIAVPACAPRGDQLRRRLVAIAADARPAAVLCDAADIPPEPAGSPALVPGVPQLVAADLADGDEGGWREPGVAPEDVALLQYTSGSTSRMKGVVLRHAHLLRNQRMIQAAFATHEESVVVSWLPLYHDMGLIGTLIHPLYLGAHCVLMTPEAFMAKPVRWLQAIARHGGTVSGGPNFAYELCARRVAAHDREGLDLGGWQVAFNGAEPVRAHTLTAFATAFAPSGFRPSAFLPCYGLAEASLLVTGGGVETLRIERRALEEGRVAPAQGDAGLALVASGGSHGLDVRVVAPETRCACAADEIGEIWVAGGSIGAGYWEQPELSAEVFGARLASGEGPFLRTGDLGFLHDGRLFVTGRVKDVLIVRGHNHHAEDLELSACLAHPALSEGLCAVSCGESGGTEGVAIVAEIRPSAASQLGEIAAAVRQRIAADHEVVVETVALMRRGGLPRTSSGKVQRGLCRALLAAGRLRLLARSDAAQATQAALAPIPGDGLRRALDGAADPDRRVLVEEYLRRQIAVALGAAAESVDLARPGMELGLDSLRAAQLQAQVEGELEVSLHAMAFRKGRPLQQMVEEILDLTTKARPRSEPPVSQEKPGDDSFRLSLDQERLWRVEKWQPGAPLNLSVAFRVDRGVDRVRLEECIGRVAQRHSALRMTVVERDGAPRGRLQPVATVCLPLVDLGPSGDGSEDGLDGILDEQSRLPFDLAGAPPFRTVLARGAAGDLFLVVTMHHIVSDAWSFSVFARELREAYAGRLASDAEARLDERRAAAYAAWQRARVPDERLERQISYWREVLAQELPAFDWQGPARRGRSEAGETGVPVAPAAPVVFDVPPETVAGLDAIARRCGTTRFVAMLAAFEALLGRASGAEEVALAVAVRGRSFPGADRPIGLFAHPVPLRVALPGDLPFTGLVARTEQSLVRAMASQDVPFARIAEFMRAAPTGSPLSTLVTDLTLPQAGDGGDGLDLAPCAFRFGSAGFAAALAFHSDDAGVRGVLSYDAAQLDRSRAERLCGEYREALQTLAARPEAALRDLPPPGVGGGRAAERYGEWRLAVASSFVAEPLEGPWGLWLDAMDVRHAVHFTPAGQMMQQLLDPASPLRSNRTGLNVVLVRASDLVPGAGVAAADNVADFVAAVRAAAEASSVAYIVCLCPPPDEADPRRREAWGEAERRIEQELRATPHVVLVAWSEVLATYPLERYGDDFGDRLASVPYTPAFFAALATMVLRRVFARQQGPAAKVLIVDADETLWAGACGEDGPAGIAVTPRHHALQEFLVAQQAGGLLLCVCSRNHAEDVEAVFAHHPDMPLRSEHIVAWRVNHRPKSENVRSIAEELGVDLAACVFLDDDPIECADVRASCAEVRVVRPTAEDDVPRLLPRLWAFDRTPTTAEDRLRTSLYLTERRRERARLAAPSLQEFIDSLSLRVDVRPLRSEDLERVAQLTLRTNQFNCTGIRAGEAELRRLVAPVPAEGWTGLVVEAADRFGEYGLVGALACARRGSALEVAWWVLSCRALGRGVEHRILAHLGRSAREAAAALVAIHYRETPRNEVARQFLHRFAQGVEGDPLGGSVFEYAADRAAACSFAAPPRGDERFGPGGAAPGFREGRPLAAPTSGDERLDLQMLEPEEIAQAAAARTAQGRVRSSSPRTRPHAATERKIAEIWGEILGVPEVGLEDAFNQTGGQSLAAVQILSRIRDVFGVEVPVATLFGRDVTLAELAKAVEIAQIEQADAHAVAEQMEALSQLTDEEVVRLLALESDG